MASDTPRTDAWLSDGKAHYMMGAHCKELERELAAMTADRDALIAKGVSLTAQWKAALQSLRDMTAERDALRKSLADQKAICASLNRDLSEALDAGQSVIHM